MKAFYTGLILFVLFLLSACGNGNSASNGNDSSESQGESAPDFLTIGTASSGSSLFLYGTALSDLLKDHIDTTQFDVEETGGAVANINLVNNADIEMGIVTVSSLQSDGGKATNVKLGWNIAPTVIHFVAKESSGIKTIEDLKGKKVSVGQSGSAANILALDILEKHGVGENDVTLSYMGWGEAMEALGDGAVDAALVLGTVPSPVIEGMGVMEDITIVNIDPSKLGILLTENKIPAKTYSGQKSDSVTVSDNMYVIFNADLSEEFVYNVTKLAMENTERLGKVHPMGGIATAPPKEQIENIKFELHPGVLKYLKEIGEYE